MAYYTKVLQTGEIVRYAGKLHWIVYKRAILSAVVTGGAVLAFQWRPEGLDSVAMAVDLTLLTVTLYLCCAAWIQRVTTEIVVTDRRIIHKVGWMSRRTQEINITKVETVDVQQGIVGRILDFGTVGIKGVGGSWEPLQKIDAPLALRNAIVVG